MKKKTLIFVLLFTILIIPLCSFAAETGIIISRELGDSKVEVTYAKPDEPVKDIIIPSKINGNIVTRIATEAFKRNSDIESVIIPNTVTEIGQGAFMLSNIKDIEIPESVTLIEENAFATCLSLESVRILGNITTIKDSTFKNCGNLKTITIPETLTSIKNEAFTSCYSLKNITIPESVTLIEEDAFKEIENSITIYGVKGSYAINYAKNKQIKCVEIDIPINECTIENLETKTYTGKAIEQNVTIKRNGEILRKDVDYTVSYKNNINVGTATVTIAGKGNYTGTVSKTFKISEKNITNATVTVDTANKTYTGKAITTTVTLKNGNTTLKNGTDYTVSYKNNINVGTATVIITGKGNYIGTISKTFKISGKNITNATVTVDTANKTYTGKAITTTVTLKDGNMTLKNGTDYTVSYKNNINVGTATVIITGKGNYMGTINKTFKIIEKSQPSTGMTTKPNTDTTTKPSTSTKYKLGDVNNDGKINTRDAREVLLSYIGKKKLTVEQKQAADVNKDGKVNTKDARQILLYYIGKIKQF